MSRTSTTSRLKNSMLGVVEQANVLSDRRVRGTMHKYPDLTAIHIPDSPADSHQTDARRGALG